MDVYAGDDYFDRSHRGRGRGIHRDWEYYERRDKDRKKFIKNSRAIPCPLQMYADWLSRYIEQGGPVGQFHDYPLRKDEILMPTQSTTLSIPAGCGALSLSLLIDPRFAGVPIDPCQSWGHDAVFAYVDGAPWVNNPQRVVVYKNVIPLLSDAARQIIAERTPKDMKPPHGWKSPVVPMLRDLTDEEVARQEGIRAVNVMNLQYALANDTLASLDILPLAKKSLVERAGLERLRESSVLAFLLGAWGELSPTAQKWLAIVSVIVAGFVLGQMFRELLF